MIDDEEFTLSALEAILRILKLDVDDRVDFAIRYMKSCLSHGVVNVENMIFPIYSVKNGIKCSKSFASILSNYGATLEVDKCG